MKKEDILYTFKKGIKTKKEQMVDFFIKNKGIIIPLSIGLALGCIIGQNIGMKTAIKQYSKNISLKANSIY